MKLSIVVITKDEEAVIRRCLESVAWADEIVALWKDIRDGCIEPQRLHEAVQPFSVKRQLGRLFKVHETLAVGGRDVADPSGQVAGRVAGPQGSAKGR